MGCLLLQNQAAQCLHSVTRSAITEWVIVSSRAVSMLDYYVIDLSAYWWNFPSKMFTPPNNCIQLHARIHDSKFDNTVDKSTQTQKVYI